MANEANQIHNLNANSADNLAINLKFYDDLKIGAEKIDAIYQQVGHLFDKQEA